MEQIFLSVISLTLSILESNLGSAYLVLNYFEVCESEIVK